MLNPSMFRTEGFQILSKLYFCMTSTSHFFFALNHSRNGKPVQVFADACKVWEPELVSSVVCQEVYFWVAESNSYN